MRFKWYAVHVMAKAEQKVKDYISKTAQKENMQNHIGEVIIPVEVDVKRKHGKKVETTTKVFPGYVLLNINLDENSFNYIRHVPGVLNFISVAGKPKSLKDSEIQSVLESINPNKGFVVKKKWSKDMNVRITSGPFTDCTGKVDEVYEEKEVMKVLISLFGRDTPLEIEFGLVEKI